jgi:sugar-phosphatase
MISHDTGNMTFMMWRSPTECQSARHAVVAVAGVAGSGKSTLGRALATALEAPLLDLDSLTNPLLDALPLDRHWLTGPHRDAVRDGRYAALRAVANDTVATAGRAVLVAPFTAELRGGEEWKLLSEAAGRGLRMVHIGEDAELFAARRAARGEERDRHRTPQPPAPAPAVPVLAVDAELTTEQQVLRVLAALGHRTAIDPSNALLAAGFDAVLCDLDGTLADSTASVLRSWRLVPAVFRNPALA